ncbi:MAG: type II toxin-antitoxin system VapC family toxin [Methanosarcinales archaeon]
MYWDSNFIVNFAYDKSKYHQECSEFLVRLENNKVESVVSVLALDEAWFVILQLRIEDDFHPQKFWEVYNSDNNVINLYLESLEKLTHKIYDCSLVKVVGTNNSWIFDALKNMKQFYFLPRDAFHIVTMQKYNIKSIVTTDEHFLCVPDIKIYTCKPSMLQMR